jgi:hypothetical protein
LIAEPNGDKLHPGHADGAMEPIEFRLPWPVSETDLMAGMAKLTYIGGQRRPHTSVIFSTEDHEINTALFEAAQRNERHNNDLLRAPTVFTVSKKEFTDVLLALEPANDRQLMHWAQGRFLSVTVVWRTHAGLCGFESRLDSGPAKILYQSIIKTLKESNENGCKIVTDQYRLVRPVPEGNVESPPFLSASGPDINDRERGKLKHPAVQCCYGQTGKGIQKAVPYR